MTKPDITIDEIVEGMARAGYANGIQKHEDFWDNAVAQAIDDYHGELPDWMVALKQRQRASLSHLLTTANITEAQLIALARGEACVVPVEPTEAMTRAGVKYRMSTSISPDNQWSEDTNALYRAMLAALKARP